MTSPTAAPPVPRKEDEALLTGQATFVADIVVPGLAHVAVLRSPHAHARILGVDASRARALPGVLAVFDGADVHAEMAALPQSVPHPALKPFTEHPLAWDKVRYVGEPVALVVAASRHVAEDALDLIAIDYEPLPAVLDIEQALEPGAPLVQDEAGDNVAGTLAQRVGDVERAFRDAPHVFEERLQIHRGAGHAIETRGIIASFEPRTRMLTVWCTSQGAHRIQRALCELLHLPTHNVRVITPFVGGGFGPKGSFDSEKALIPWAAIKLGVPVKWIEDRREHALAAKQERDQVHRVAIAVDDNGVILGMKDSFLHDSGAFAGSMVTPWIAATTIPGPYRIPNFAVDFRMVFTNKVPTVVVRGAGRPQAVFVMERMIERIARELKIDPVEVRRRNMIQPEQQPFDTGLIFRDNRPMIYDSGDYPTALAKALEIVDYAGFPAYQAQARAEGRYVGLGVACYVEGNGLGPYEGATVRVEGNGQVIVLTGATPQGQGHQTMMAQVCAEQLGVSVDQVTVVTGDTAGIPKGVGTFGSRSSVVAGSAVHEASGQVRDKVVRVAASMLECAPEQIRLQGGRAVVADDPSRGVTLGAVAHAITGVGFGYALPAGLEPTLEATVYFRPERATYAYGSHAAIVEVDPDTGFVRIEKYVGVDDCGRIIHPAIVRGQTIGGVAHGVGNTLYEEIVYDEIGQPLNTSFMDYLLPGATEVPEVILAHTEVPSPLNPLGVKGAGEGGTLPAPACLASAIEHALASFGAWITALPLRPEHIANLARVRDE
jgi:carbon-monoxide dehydrogenase large subunit